MKKMDSMVIRRKDDIIVMEKKRSTRIKMETNEQGTRSLLTHNEIS